MAQTYSREQYRSGEHALTLEESALVLGFVDDVDSYVAIKLAMATGIRREDLAALKWSGVDFVGSKISYYEKKKRRTWTVFIDQGMVSDLKKLFNLKRNRHYLFTGGSEVIYGQGHVTGRTLWNRFQKVLDDAGLKRRPFHALRATCVKLCQAKGWTVEQTAKHIGDTVRVVQEHYSAPSMGEMQSVAQEKPLV